ncbi:MAG: Putative DNA-binding protein in cluster with Type I restriction-modification system [uncultured Sulfurovum sp.]|uniref:DNA-binding protein in cluster with Type I restriction-modification system n=1 Tax=uncultured Sulfurovum sp. TaxID=269237 RepID=A0A6S6SJ36_9BACT|nr:MAG: Putative DNA-binding protein in cluster with Type I restriction-modification system [uncultured Sulfurovum sp.]
MDQLVVQGEISSRILTLRGKQVMLDRDLAELYQVKAIRLREQVKRNIKRFPSDFMFQLNVKEVDTMVSQNAIPSKQHLGGALPYVFTEQGVYMLATVLKSDVAIDINIAIMRTFTKLREFSKHYNALAKQLIEVDRKHDKQYKELKKALDELIATSEVANEKVMGFLK